jgi:transposase
MPRGHLAYLVRDLVKELDLSAIYGRYKGSRGAAPFDPRMLVGILLYAWASSIYSSRKMAALCVQDLGGRFLAAGHQPDFRTISKFRLEHGEALAGLFAQSVRLCREAGMVSLGHVAIDGSKFGANASIHRVMTYSRMLEIEERLQREIAEYQRRSLEADALEDTLFGPSNDGPELPEEMKDHKTRLARIRAAREALEEQTRAAAEAKRQSLEEERAEKEAQRGKRLGGRQPKAPKTEPDGEARRNVTDPDCRKMRTGMGEWVQGYNGQAAVDSDRQVIVACELTNTCDDTPHFQPLFEQVLSNMGRAPQEVSADAGYFSMANVEAALACSSQPLLPPDRMGPYYQSRYLSEAQTEETTDETEASVTLAPIDKVVDPERACLENLSIKDWMRIVLSTQAGAKAYARRRETVETVFAQIKGSPGSPGFRQVLRRGLKKARQEWLWVCATHNFKKYLQFRSVAELSL